MIEHAIGSFGDQAPAPAAGDAAPKAQPAPAQPANDTVYVAVAPKRGYDRRQVNPSTYRSYVRQASTAAVPSAAKVRALETHKAPETLVLIQTEKDGSTGASNAVELHQTQDVIVSS